MNIYVGNLDFKVEEIDLEGIFGEYGNVEEVKIIKDRFSGRSKGYGFIIMNDATEGKKAMEELNGATLEDREMVVSEGRQKSESQNNHSSNSWRN